MKKTHSFHIPVMGIGFTIDTPLKVAQYGIDSVISLVDDILLEKLRKMYCEKFEIPYTEISSKVKDFRSKRITSYLNLMNDLVDKKFESLKNYSADKVDDIKAYLNMLPNGNKLKEEFNKLTEKGLHTSEIKNWVFKNFKKGSIDVNIMTKVDKENYFKNEKLPSEYNDAHAALRGFATSNLNAAVILSAGLNPKLFTYMAQFDDFYPDENGQFKKRIILKVSDYRSALIQGKFLAKKGLWVSEYRIESGLNCGGHAFATDGFLLGPVLAEFKKNREMLRMTIQDLLTKALETTNRVVPSKPLKLEISAQGGVGTHHEHEFLIHEYALDSVGWGSPFLLVPEATTVDDETLKKLAKAKEDDLYLSNISPLGVPFNNLKHNTKDIEKEHFIVKGRPGSSCSKKFVALNKEFTEKGVCTASRKYQNLKIKELQTKNLSSEQYQIQFNKITEKSCTCVGLGTSALLAYGLDTKVEGKGVSICPGPNMAYYSNVMSLKNIIDHIYGRDDMISRRNRPHMFIKELNIYTDYLKNKFENIKHSFNDREVKYLQIFSENMQSGIAYYKNLFNRVNYLFEDIKASALQELERNEAIVIQIQKRINSLSLAQ
ncbi:hypothetical protein [Seonamhaeicola aphaedonensis]|uniref:Uncharacterized protein n=1 Tax=Seonamhaeicola aphaedonensis TaxID=1461338 RepID=A0A3D9H873_9FLAO|nr:hypothetical protein [Seonamhaeicola aphaedonensis]RED45692.1 hypothetical protein DFQ02_10870 [Seonamhaeicola aphaedonensis]